MTKRNERRLLTLKVLLVMQREVLANTPTLEEARDSRISIHRLNGSIKLLEGGETIREAVH